MFDALYKRYETGQTLGDCALNMINVYFPDACPDTPPEFHRIMLHWFFSSYKRTVCAAPRGHAKSTICSQIAVLCAVALRLDHNIILASSTLPQSIDLLTAIKNELQANETFCRDNGISMDKKDIMTWNQEVIELRLTDGFLVRISAKSSGSSLRGTKFNNWRPSLILLDDIEDEENVSTPEQRNKLKSWLYSVIVPALDPKKWRIRFVGTVLHEDSLLNSCIKNPRWHPAVFKAHNKDFSHILWPERFTKEMLMDLKDDFKSEGKEHLYYMEYLNTVIPVGGAFFSVEKIKKVSFIPEGAEFYSACDLAISVKDQADYTVIVTGAMFEDKLYIADIKRGRWGSEEIIDAMLRTERQYHPTNFVIESGAIQKSITPFLEVEERKYHTYISKSFVQPVKDKKSRARGLQGLVSRGYVYILETCDYIDELSHELEKFGSTNHDDIVDALSHLVNDMQYKLTAPKEEDYEEKMKEHFIEEFTDVMVSHGLDDDWGF